MVAARLVSGLVMLFVSLMHSWNSDEPVCGMNTRSHKNGSKTQSRPDLRAWTSLNAFPIIMIGVVLGAFVFRDTRYFRFLWSMHALVAVIPILGVLRVHVATVGHARLLAVTALAVYGASMAMPALRLGGDLVFGWGAVLLSFDGLEMFWGWGGSGTGFWYPIACSFGVVVNISFVLGGGAFLRGRIFVARRLATTAAILSASVLLPLCMSGKLDSIYAGYGMWTSSALLLALGSWRAPTEIQSVGDSG